jgi:endonuclease I
MTTYVPTVSPVQEQKRGSPTREPLKSDCPINKEAVMHIITPIRTTLEKLIKTDYDYNKSSDFVKKLKKKIYVDLTTEELQNWLAKPENPVLNIEHTVPISLFGKREWFNQKRSPVYYDPHNLYLTDSKINAYRENYSYGQVNNPTLLFNTHGDLYVKEDQLKNAYYDCETNDILYTCLHGKCTENKITGTNYLCGKNVKRFTGVKDTRDYTAIDNSGAFDQKIRVSYKSHHECKGENYKRCIIEPLEKQKGTIARSVLYMYLVYVLPILNNLVKDRFGIKLNAHAIPVFFNKSSLDLYKKWNIDHPPTKDEMENNLAIGKQLGILNPFIQYYNDEKKEYVYDPHLPNYLFPCYDEKFTFNKNINPLWQSITSPSILPLQNVLPIPFIVLPVPANVIKPHPIKIQSSPPPFVSQIPKPVIAFQSHIPAPQKR